MKTLMAVVLMVLMVPALAVTPRLVNLTADEAAYAGANVALDVDVSACTLATTNTAQVWTNALAANTEVQCIGAKLLVPFDTGRTNGVALTVGETSGGTNWVNSVQLAKNSTPIYWKGGGTADSNGVITTRNYYSAATNLFVSLTPASSAMVDNKQGKVRIYFRIR